MLRRPLSSGPGRRGFFARGELALKLEPLIAARAKKNQQLSEGRGKKGPKKSADLLETRDELAKIAGVSHDTISKVKLVVECADEETKSLLRKSKSKSRRIQGKPARCCFGKIA